MILCSVLLTTGCGPNARWAFSPGLSELVDAKYEKRKPIAEKYSFAWERVMDELDPAKRLASQKGSGRASSASTGTHITSTSVSGIGRSASQMTDLSKKNTELANTAELKGIAQAHHDQARANADMAIAFTETEVAMGQMQASAGLFSAFVGVHSAMAQAGELLNEKSYSRLSRLLIGEMNLVGDDAPKGSTLHLEFHYGVEPSYGRNFMNGLAMLFGGPITARNSFMVTAVLTLPGGGQISSTRLMNMRFYAGWGTAKKAFPEGFEQIPIKKIFTPGTIREPKTMDKDVLKFLARATIEDVRKAYRKRKK